MAGNTSQIGKIDAFRRRILFDFAIRGTKREFSKKGKLDYGREMPTTHAYFVNPMANLSSKEWLAKLHATVYAAVARGMNHGLMKGELVRKNWGELSPNSFPTIMVFGTNVGRGNLTKYSLLDLLNSTKGLLRIVNPKLKFKDEFSHNREKLEKGVVHGIARPTFSEAEFHPHDRPVLFRVNLTKKDVREIRRNIQGALKKGGTTFGSLAKIREDMADPKMRPELANHYRDYLWQSVLRAKKLGKIEYTDETSVGDPIAWMFYDEASKILTRKLIKRGNEWLEKNTME
ncbi:hypothetical protein HY989_00860 [Candidatus Micrarchaeota archaeon]|nr:hypothetical protein [Candidatus Micrarchaeota archaeon]